MTSKKKLLQKLLFKHPKTSNLNVFWLSSCLGFSLVFVLFITVYNFYFLLHNNQTNLSGDFITISKQINDENIGKPERYGFSYNELRQIRNEENVKDIGIITESHFPVNLALQSNFSFSTKIFLESIPEKFLDNKPLRWSWQNGSREIPIIVSSDYIKLFNYAFAFNQGFPQLTDSGLQSLAFDLTLGPIYDQETYSAHVVGFSNRINSILVPSSFMDFANKKYGVELSELPSRLVLSIADPSDNDFYQFLKRNKYQTNFEVLKWNKLRKTIEIMTCAVNVFLILFASLFLTIMLYSLRQIILKKKESLTLLSQIGYNPDYLKKIILSRFSSILFTSIGVAILIMCIVQWYSSIFITKFNLQLPSFPDYAVCLVVLFMSLMTIIISRFILLKNLEKE